MKQPQNERNLREVREILQRLQRIASDPESPGISETRQGHDALTEEAAPLMEDHNEGEDNQETASFRKRRLPVIRVAASVGVALVIVVLMVFGAEHLWQASLDRPAAGLAPPKQEPILAKRTAPEAVAQAQKLMADGRVVAARDILLKAAGAESADAALALARSYDPAFLSSIQAADTGADIVEAERWYRRWHELAVKDGLRMDAERLDRLIRAMREPQAGR